MSATSTGSVENPTAPGSNSAEPSCQSALEPLDVDNTQKNFEERDATPERMRAFFLQSLIPFLIAGGGLIASGVFLTYATTWNFVSSNCQVIVLIPAFIGMKGNLEISFLNISTT